LNILVNKTFWSVAQMVEGESDSTKCKNKSGVFNLLISSSR